MHAYFWVAVGSALGGMARHWCTIAAAQRVGGGFPWGTVLVNITGSFVIGLFAALTGPQGRLAVPVEARLFVIAGLCGGFTTFSAFSLQTFEFLRLGDWAGAGGNVLLSVVLCLAAVGLGHVAGTAFGTGGGG